MRRRRDLSVVSAIFFVSGAAGLIYQVVWSRMLSDVFGVSIHAITASLEEEQKAVGVLEASGNQASVSDARAALEGYRRHVPLPGMIRPPPATP